MKRIYKISIIVIGLVVIGFVGSDHILKTSPGWMRTYGGTGRDCDSPYGIEKISENEYLITGTSNSFSRDGEDDVLLIDIDIEGNVNFSKTFGKDLEDRLHKVQKINDDEYIGVGYSTNSNNDKDFLLIKFNREGNLLWSKILGGEDDQVGYSITKTSDGNFVAVGWEGKMTGEGQDILVVKIDEDGNLLWAKILGTPDDEEQGYSVASTNDGGVLILGKKGIERMEALGHSNLLLIKLDSTGFVNFSKTIGGDTYYYLISPVAIEKTKDNGYIIGVETYSEESGKDGAIIKLDEEGNILWTRIVGTLENNERFRSAIETENGNYIVVGDLYNYERSDGLLVKLNKNGRLIDSRVFSGGNQGEINRLDVIREISGDFLISGKTNFYGAGDFDNLIIKVDQNYKSFQCDLLKKKVDLFEKEATPQEDSLSLQEEDALLSMNFFDISFNEKDISEEIKTSILCK